MIWIILALLAVALYYLTREREKAVQKPLRPYPRVKTVDSEECRIAVHEAGHASVAWSCTAVTGIDIMNVASKNGGHVLYRLVGDKTPEGMWCSLVITLAGIAAEARVYRRLRSAPARTDLLRARELAEALIVLGNTEPPWDTGDDLPKTLDFAGMFLESPSPEVIQILEYGYGMARTIVEGYGHTFYRLVSMLLAKRIAYESDAEGVLGKRFLIRSVGLAQSTFVVPRQRR